MINTATRTELADLLASYQQAVALAPVDPLAAIAAGHLACAIRNKLRTVAPRNRRVIVHTWPVLRVVLVRRLH